MARSMFRRGLSPSSTAIKLLSHVSDSNIITVTLKSMFYRSQRSHGRLTCKTWRAWSTRGHLVWLLPIHPTRVAPSSARSTCRRSSKVSYWPHVRANIWPILWDNDVRVLLVFQWPPDTVSPFWQTKSTATWWVTTLQHSVSCQVGLGPV